MRIYADILHVPYLHNLALAFPEHSFFTPYWSVSRELPPNVTHVNPDEYRNSPMDVVIDSVRRFENFDRKCRRRIKLLHMERGANTTDDEVFIEECLNVADAVVFVSDHKRWTFMDAARHPKVTVIPFGVALVQLGRPEPGVAGTVHNFMNSQQEMVWRFVRNHFPNAELTGFGNAQLGGVEPSHFSEFNARFSRLDVMVHVVVGNSMGFVIPEAMMRGIPIVTGLNKDIPKEMIDGWNCLITKGHAHDCLDEMVEAVHRLINDRGLRLRIGHAARDTAKRIYGLDKFRKNWTNVFL